MKRSRFARSEESIVDPLLRPLFDDVVECEELLDRADTQFARRTFVRAAFAFNEGFVFWLREQVARWLVGGPRHVDNVLAKLLLLSDEVFRPNQQGKLDSEPNRIPFLNNCAFVLRTASECCNFDPLPLFSDNGWREMRQALQIRHRITHPKAPSDLEITDDELESVSEAHRWLFNSLVAILNSR